MRIEPTKLIDVLILEPQRHGDTRGFFSEVWSRARMEEAGLSNNFVQDNQSLSAVSGTLRGLHYQSPPHAQTKLVRCGRGALWDVVVDFRAGSPSFGRWIGVDLTAENGRQVLIPAGFLHGFVTRVPDTEILYKCTDYYAPECDGVVAWDDPDLAIDWSTDAPVLSDKDARAPRLADTPSPFTWEGS